jgi:hypothetical protein
MADLARVAQTVAAAAEGEQNGLLDRLCRACASALAVEGTAISVMVGQGQPLLRSASDERVTRLEELQFTLGEGPALTAFAQGEMAWTPDLRERQEGWPVFAAEAAALVERSAWRICAVFAFPLRLGREQLGVVDVYRGEPGFLPDEGLAEARIAVDTAAMALAAAAATGQDGVPAWMREVPSDQVELDQAVGMVMAQLGVGPAEALSRLRAHAFVGGRSLGGVARSVAARELRFSREDR